MNSFTTFNLSNCEKSLQSVRSKWEEDFEKNQKEFSQNTTAGIMKKTLGNFENSCSDPYKQLPNKKSPLASQFSFEIVKSKDALMLKELASDSAELSPFKEWFERFANPQKNSMDSSTIESNSIMVRSPEREKGIDREYFQELMAIVGRSVAKNLKESFDQIASLPENSRLNAEITWFRKEDQLLSNPSDLRDNKIEVKLWMDQGGKQQLKTISSIASSTIIKEREARKKTQATRQILYITGAIVFFAICLFTALSKR